MATVPKSLYRGNKLKEKVLQLNKNIYYMFKENLQIRVS